MFKNLNRHHLKVYFNKYLRVFWYSKGFLKILSTFIITALVLLATSSDSFKHYEETKITLFAIVCAAIWTGLFNSIEVISSERNAIKQEHLSGNVDYSVFLTAHLLVEALLSLVEATIIMGLILIFRGKYFRINEFLDFSKIIPMFFSLWLIIFTADVLGLMISSMVKSNKMAMTVMPFALIVQLVLSDFIFELEGWKSVLSNFTIAKWGLRALGISVEVNSLANKAVENANSVELERAINTFVDLGKHKKLSEFSSTIPNFLLVTGVLIVFIIVQIFIAKIFLNRIDQDER